MPREIANNASDDEMAKEERDLRKIRQIYLPEIVLAYFTAVYTASKMGVANKVLESLDVLNGIVRNEELLRCITAAKRVTDLTRLMTMLSKEHLRSRHGIGHGGKGRKLKKSTGLVPEIFDVKVTS